VFVVKRPPPGPTPGNRSTPPSAVPGGKVIYRKSGSIDPLEVRRAIVAHLGQTY